MNENLERLKKYFSLAVATFEFMHALKVAAGGVLEKSYMHRLHLELFAEINKESPDMQYIDNCLAKMEEEAEKNAKP